MQNAESNDWEDESATASREEMLERQVQSLFEEKLGSLFEHSRLSTSDLL
jgi:hypothetical protein